MLYLLFAIGASAAMALALKLFRAPKGNRYGLLLGNYITCAALSFFLLPDKGTLARLEGATLLCGGVSGVLYVVSLVAMQRSIARNGATLSAAFSKLGLLVPLLLSMGLFGERPGAFQWLGLGLAALALFFINSRSGAGEELAPAAPAPALLLLTLLCSGVCDTMAKVFERLGSRDQDGVYFLILFSVAVCLTAGLALLEARRTGKGLRWQEMAAGIAVGVPNYCSSFLLLQALVRLPAYLVYPMFSTGTILLVALLSALLFQEKPGKRQALGLGLILAALALLNA